jgi:tetraether lipid synthase
MTATLTKWYEEHGRHEIFAGGKNVAMETNEHSLYLRDGIVTQEEQRDLDKLGIAKNAREEKIRARDAKAKEAVSHQPLAVSEGETGRGPKKNDAAYDARMAALYREVVLKEKPVQSENGFISLDALVKPNGNGNGNGHSAPETKPEVEEPVAGD